MVCVRVAFHENDGNHENDENDEDNSDSHKQGFECWNSGNHGNHENDENHRNPWCKRYPMREDPALGPAEGHCATSPDRGPRPTPPTHGPVVLCCRAACSCPWHSLQQRSLGSCIHQPRDGCVCACGGRPMAFENQGNNARAKPGRVWHPMVPDLLFLAFFHFLAFSFSRNSLLFCAFFLSFPVILGVRQG